jgi:hypothetical protein
MKGWRQRRLGSNAKKNPQGGKTKADLTHTGLLMEGVMRGLVSSYGITAVAWFEKPLSTPVESTAVVT